MKTEDRIPSLDALRAFALLLGVALHASMSFLPGMIPGIWAAVDVAPSRTLATFFFVTHTFRMTLFFVIAGFFASLLIDQRGAAGFARNRLVRIGAPLVAGWMIVYPAIVAVWTFGLRQHFNGAPPAMPAEMMKRPDGWFPFAHLWFLYYLLMLYAGALAVRAAFKWIDVRGVVAGQLDRALHRLIHAGVAPFVLGVPIALVLHSLPRWIAFAGIPAPDQTYIPQLPALVAYGIAFAVGCSLFRVRAMLDLIGRRTLANAAIALLATGVAMTIAGVGLKFGPPPVGAAKALLVFAYASAGWAWTLALIGLAVRFLDRESRATRYIADASYWVYLMHLPVVAAADVLVARWPLHWVLKFGLVLGGSLLLLFASYALFVRWTFVGRLLNGRVTPWRAPAAGRSLRLGEARL